MDPFAKLIEGKDVMNNVNKIKAGLYIFYTSSFLDMLVKFT